MRNAILEKAEQQLMVGGFDKLNFAKIANELNTTRANLHYHFKNKETLAIEVFKQYSTRHCEEFKSLREKFKGNYMGFFEAVDHSFWDQPDCEDSNGASVCTSLVSDPELPAPIAKMSRDLYGKIEQVIVGVIQDALNNGEIRADIDVEREAARSHVIMMGILSSGQHLFSNREAKEQLGGLLIDWANSLK